MRVVVLGAGSWGSTVAALVAGRDPTMVWARDAEVADEINQDRTNTRYLPGVTLPPLLEATDDIEKAVAQAELLIVGVPSHGFRETLEAAKGSVRPWIPVVSLTKGLERDSLLRMTEVVKDVLPGHPAAALTGPNIAREIMGGQAAASVIATEDLAVARALQQTLRRGLLRIYTNHDVIGCELGGALKNVIALACGMAQGLAVGDNTRAAVMTRGLAELTRLGV
ncbi:MAG TPA: NAD(P)H-dependent glycerol-3-phosphate dehydrogenase, partial [Acidimicrobiales bacterium]